MHAGGTRRSRGSLRRDPLRRVATRMLPAPRITRHDGTRRRSRRPHRQVWSSSIARRSLGKTHLIGWRRPMEALVANSRPARGVLYVHSSPRALCPHVEWAAGRALGHAVNFTWDPQPVLKGAMRAEYYWEGPEGSGAAIASGLRGWEHLRYEVTEDAGPGRDGGRWMHTPDLGVFFAQTDTAGNTVIPEPASATHSTSRDPTRWSCTASSASPWGRPGTTSWRPSATRATSARWSGCTRSADPRAASGARLLPARLTTRGPDHPVGASRRGSG